jgi:hypothetical protein
VEERLEKIGHRLNCSTTCTSRALRALCFAVSLVSVFVVLLALLMVRR